MPPAEDSLKALLGTDEFKGYIDSVIKNIAPLFIGAGLGAFVPFISPLIIAGLTSHLLPKALKVAGGRIEVAHEQLLQYEKEGGSKAILAKVASPCLGVLKKVIPAPEKELHEALSEGSTKLKQFFSVILKDDVNRKEFEGNLQQFLTGGYDNFEEFQRNVKETMGISADRLAIEAYSQFASIIYNRDILNKIVTLEEISENDRKDIREKFEELHAEFDKQLKRALHEIEQMLIKELTDQQLLSSGLYLVTGQTRFVKGEADCWVEGHFRDGDIKSGYDARREVTNDIIKSIDNNIGTIIYGRPHYGKTLILKRVMFEQIEKGEYAIIFCRDVEANANRLIRLLERASASFSKLLVIVDNAHRKGSEEIFVAFNNLPLSYDVKDYHYHSSYQFRFLFAAREAELRTMIENLSDRDKAIEVRNVVRKLEGNKITLSFDIRDAILFVEKALAVAKPKQVDNISKEYIKSLAEYYYNEVSRHDPFVFVYALMRYIAKDEVASKELIDSFIASEMDEKINSLTEQQDKRTALLCSFMGAFGIRISLSFTEQCGFYENRLMSLLGKSILFKNGEYTVRHELWALEFLVHIFSRKCNDNYSTFDNIYGIGDIIRCVLNNVSTNVLFNILSGTVHLYNAQRFQHLGKVIIDNFVVVLEHLTSSPNDKADLYCFGLGNFYHNIQDPLNAIKYYDKALELNSSHVGAWNNKGVILYGFANYELAINCFDKALELNRNYADAWYNKGKALRRLGNYELAINCFDKALELNSSHVGAWNNKGLALSNLHRYLEAIVCYDKAIKINPNDVGAWYNRARSHVKRGDIGNGLADLKKAIEINKNALKLAKQQKDFESIRNDERFKALIAK